MDKWNKFFVEILVVLKFKQWAKKTQRSLGKMIFSLQVYELMKDGQFSNTWMILLPLKIR